MRRDTATARCVRRLLLLLFGQMALIGFPAGAPAGMPAPESRHESFGFGFGALAQRTILTIELLLTHRSHTPLLYDSIRTIWLGVSQRFSFALICFLEFVYVVLMLALYVEDSVGLSMEEHPYEF